MLRELLWISFLKVQFPYSLDYLPFYCNQNIRSYFTSCVSFTQIVTFIAQPGGLGLFRQQLNRNETNGVQCPQSVSCMPAPWCRRTVDTNGCTKCRCSMGKWHFFVYSQHQMVQWSFLSCILLLFQQPNCIDWINRCHIRSLTEIQLFCYHFHVLSVELWEASCKSVYFPLIENMG